MVTHQHITLIGLFLLISASSVASDGQSLFETHCQKCHFSGAESLRSESGEIKQLLASGKIKKHRFTLSEEQIDAVSKYIAMRKGQ